MGGVAIVGLVPFPGEEQSLGHGDGQGICKARMSRGGVSRPHSCIETGVRWGFVNKSSGFQVSC